MSDLTALGIDPGISRTGVSVVRRVEGRYKSIYLKCHKTQPFKGKKKKERHGIRTTDDDVRRIKELTDNISLDIMKQKPDLVAVEAYVPLQGKASSGHRTAYSYAMCVVVAHLLGAPVYVYIPGDIKSFVGYKSASKDQVRQFIEDSYIPDADWGKVKGDMEHLGDATALAIMAILERDQIAHQLCL